MTDQLLHHWWDAPTLGEFPSLPPDQIPAGGARALRNFLVHQPHKITPRGNIGIPGAAVGSVVNAAGAPLAGTVAFQDYCTCSFRAVASGPLVDHWRVPINRPTSAGQLVQPYLAGDGLRPADILSGSAGTPAGVSDADRVPSERNALLNGFVYSPSIGGTSVSIPGGVAQQNLVVRYSSLSIGNRFQNGPVFVQDVAAHYNRLFVVAGRDPGVGSGYNPSALYWCVEGGLDGSDLLADWKDPVSGLINKIEVGSSLNGDFCCALGRVNGHLVIFKRNSVWILYGTSSEDFTLRQLRSTSGCVEPRSVVTADDGVYFASQYGYEKFDGRSFSLVSGPVSDTWLEFSNRGPGASTTNHSYIRCEALPNGYIFVAFGTDPFAAFAADGAERNWLYHMESGAWTQVATAHAGLGLSAAGAVNRALMLPNSVSLWGASKWARADKLTYGPDTTNGLRDADGSTNYAVALSWTTGVADLGRQWEAARFNRGTADYRHTWVDATPTNGGAMGTAALYDDTGTIIATPGTLPGYRPATAPLRVRPTFDANHEAPQGGVEMVVASNIGSSSSARTGEFAIYGAGVEYQAGRGRRKA